MDGASAIPQVDLIARDVHVWTMRIDAVRSPQYLTKLLSPDERARAHRFRAERDRRRFVICRGVLRSLLSRYLNDAPATLAFRYGPHGKPALRSATKARDLRFSVAHCRDRALFAVTLGREVGVDVECVHTDRPTDEIAERFFSPHETAAMRALPAADRQCAFFRLWTRKEAFLKARGDGLSTSLRDFAVSAGPDARLLWTSPDPLEAARWRLEDVRVGADHAGAVAAEGTDWVLRCWEWR